MEIYRKRFARLIAALTLLVTTACSDSDAEPGNSATPVKSGTVFKEHQITDPGMNNIVATTVLVPEGWQVEGGMTRPAPQFFNMPVMLDIKFTAPDGRQVRQFPTYRFEYNYQRPQEHFSPTMSGNMYLPLFESMGSWMLEMIRLFPDEAVSKVRLIEEQALPEITDTIRRASAQLYQMASQSKSMGMQTGIYFDFDAQATRVVLQYEQDGQKLEESILLVWQSLVNYVYGQPSGGTWGINQMYSLRGPVGSDYLNDPQMMAILHSARPNPVWVNEMQKHWAEMARIRNKGAQQRRQQSYAAHQKRMQTLNETSDIIANGWKSRSQMSDAGHSAYIDSIHEVTPYQTPAGKTVKLPSFYKHVYTDSNGHYLLNNDPNYQPNTDPAVNQREWQRIPQMR